MAAVDLLVSLGVRRLKMPSGELTHRTLVEAAAATGLPLLVSTGMATLDEVRELFALPFSDLIYHAQRVHRLYFDPNQVQISTLLSIKTGACPEDCSYCSQSIRFEGGRIAERGGFEELVAQGGRFAALVRTQLTGHAADAAVRAAE